MHLSRPAQSKRPRALRALEIRLLDAHTPPQEVRIFPFGTIPTSKGTLRFTTKSAELVQKQWSILQRQFGFDFGHDTFAQDKPSSEKIAAGWGDLTIRPDGLYVTGIEWTPQAAQKILTKEFRYLSPACSDKGGEIVAVYNCALTNLPATYAAVPLVLSSTPHLRGMSAKHNAIALGMYQHLTGLMSHAKEAGESDHAALQACGKKLSDMLPEHYSALEAMMSEMGVEPHKEPDGDEAPAEVQDKTLSLLHDTIKSILPGKEQDLEASVKEAFQVLAAVQRATGKETGLVGAVLALADTVKRLPKVDPAHQRAIEKGIKARKIHPSDVERFAALSAEDVESYIELAQPIEGPRALVSDLNGTAKLTGKAPTETKLLEAEKAAQARADELLSLAFDTSDEEAA